MQRSNTCPVHDVVSNLVFACNSGNVHTVFVGGRKVMQAGRILGMEESVLLDQAQERALHVRSQLGLSNE